MDLKVKFLVIGILFISSCNNPEQISSKNLNSQKSSNFTLEQGPSSTGGIFRLFEKDGSPLKSSTMKIFSLDNNAQNELYTTTTDDKGEAYVPSQILSPSIIKRLKNDEISILIKIEIDNSEITAKIKNIEYISNSMISVQAELEAPRPLAVNLSQKSLNINIGNISELSAFVEMSDGTKNNAINWSSSDETVAVVKNAKISALKKGVTIITASAIADNNIYNKISLTVTDDSKINYLKIINPFDKNKISGPVIIKVHQNYQLEAIAVLSDGSTSSNINWKSSDESVLIIGKNSGIATGRSKGKVTVTAFSTDDISQKDSIEFIIE